jgi:tetratricopeptide (TPR) repeat protein
MNSRSYSGARYTAQAATAEPNLGTITTYRSCPITDAIGTAGDRRFGWLQMASQSGLDGFFVVGRMHCAGLPVRRCRVIGDRVIEPPPPQIDAPSPTLPLGDALLLAAQWRAEGRLPEAKDLLERILAAQPKLSDAEHLLGIVAHQSGQLNEAIGHVRRATELAPAAALYHANLGEMLRLAGRPRLAAEAARRAIAIDPSMAMAYSNLGVALYELKDYAEAERAQRQAIALSPDFTEAHSNLGNALHAQRRYDEAIIAYGEALALDPSHGSALANLGTTLHHSGSFDEGIATLRHAIALAPYHANAHCGLGLLLMMRGEFAEGWDEYEWRLRSTERTGPRFPNRPWQGESLAGKHIYVQAEQGFGDSLQFIRYIPLLIARGAMVTVRVHQEIVTLARESFPGVTILGDRGEPKPYDCDVALLSLPHLFKTRLETIPAAVPYLRPPTAAAERWATRLAGLQGFKVGLVWAGNPEHINDARRSISLTTLAPLLALPNVSFVSLQAGPRSADLKKRGKRQPPIDDLAPQLTDFEATAGAVAALDLVVTVDTSVAHLAGALGKPTWVPMPWVADWRWMLEREDSPWYPTMRLFRQKRGQDWAEIVGRIAEALAAVVRGDDAALTPFKAEGERRAVRAEVIIAAEAASVGAVHAASEQNLTAGGALLLAEQKRRHNFLGDADELARRAAAADPNNAEAAHTLGLIAHQSGKLVEAIEHVRRAVALAPDNALYHANLGEMCRMAGRVDEAIAVGSRAIELDSQNASAHSNLGIAYFDQGRFEEALPHYERAIALQPEFAQAHSNRGNTLQRLKRFAEAEPCYRRALELQPAFTDAWNNLGTCLRELKRPDDAIVAYKKVLELQPNNPDALDNLGLVLKDLERFAEAADAMRRALVIASSRAAFHTHYGSVLVDQEKFDEAEAAVGRALSLNPSDHDAANQMGRIAFERGDLEASLTHYRRALDLKPDLADAYNNMGNTLKELGRLQEAHDAYLEALRLDPSVTGTYVNLADSKTFTPDDPHVAAMEGLAATTLSKKDRMQLDFALGKAYADLKDYPRSFAHLRDANAAKRAMVTHDEAAAFEFLDRIESAFTRELIRAKTGGGDPSSAPIFVIGMPRSGTTLVEQILASHPMVFGAGELKTLAGVVTNVLDPAGNQLSYPEFVPALDTTALRSIGAQYIAELRKLAPGRERVTDKMPSNYCFTGLIHLALPNARIVHCVRDPVDTCVSCFSKLFAGQQVHTYDLAELGRYYRRYERLMAHWRRVLPKDRMLDIRYENVVADLETQARRLLAYCGLPWDERCLAFYETERPIRTASATQARRPIYNSAIGRWRVYENELQPLLAALA